MRASTRRRSDASTPPRGGLRGQVHACRCTSGISEHRWRCARRMAPLAPGRGCSCARKPAGRLPHESHSHPHLLAHGNPFDRRHLENRATVHPYSVPVRPQSHITARPRLTVSMPAQHKPGVFRRAQLEIQFPASPPQRQRRFSAARNESPASFFASVVRFASRLSHRPPQPRFRASQHATTTPARRRFASPPPHLAATPSPRSPASTTPPGARPPPAAPRRPSADHARSRRHPPDTAFPAMRHTSSTQGPA